MKGGRFTWTSEAAKAFDNQMVKETEAPVLALPNFDEAFLVECDASGLGIGGVLSQNQWPITFFSNKLNDARRKYSTYDKEFYVIVRRKDIKVKKSKKTSKNRQEMKRQVQERDLKPNSKPDQDRGQEKDKRTKEKDYFALTMEDEKTK
ncbi:reverse transcriptase domain-containing protein, partial [Tanacetum coccineum]